ncbi:hypothetical protein GDO78_022031 [Eleutherodactylus coqui]|uniref:Uncharacterized protein n=1 Tax=Eleutherodactylus coqui TaxID=57060 RepID=A0A8J6EGT3_ELECQ|nr:hypothetical protein GDO78_022031 [Eleutherodactylus coqui]
MECLSQQPNLGMSIIGGLPASGGLQQCEICLLLSQAYLLRPHSTLARPSLNAATHPPHSRMAVPVCYVLVEGLGDASIYSSHEKPEFFTKEICSRQENIVVGRSSMKWRHLTGSETFRLDNTIDDTHDLYSHICTTFSLFYYKCSRVMPNIFT